MRPINDFKWTISIYLLDNESKKEQFNFIESEIALNSDLDWAINDIINRYQYIRQRLIKEYKITNSNEIFLFLEEF